MKLEPRGKLKTGKGSRAGEVLQPDRRRSDSDVFDPRFDLPPGETQRLIAQVEHGQEPNDMQEKRKLEDLVWLVWVDPRFQVAMQQLDTFKPEHVLAEFVMGVRTDRAVDSVFVMLDEVLQVHPEARTEFASFLGDGIFFDQVKAQVGKLSTVDLSNLNRTTNTLRMIRLWPEKATELRDYFFPPTNRAGEIETHLAEEQNHWVRVVNAAEYALLFPEMREQILHSITPDLKLRTGELAVMLRSNTHATGFGVLQHYLASLNILYAEQAFIDHTGKVRIQLPALPKDRNAVLPDRLNA